MWDLIFLPGGQQQSDIKVQDTGCPPRSGVSDGLGKTPIHTHIHTHTPGVRSKILERKQEFSFHRTARKEQINGNYALEFVLIRGNEQELCLNFCGFEYARINSFFLLLSFTFIYLGLFILLFRSTASCWPKSDARVFRPDYRQLQRLCGEAAFPSDTRGTQPAHCRILLEVAVKGSAHSSPAVLMWTRAFLICVPPSRPTSPLTSH